MCVDNKNQACHTKVTIKISKHSTKIEQAAFSKISLKMKHVEVPQNDLKTWKNILPLKMMTSQS